LQLGHRLRKDEAGEEIAVGVLLQIDEMSRRADPQRMAEDLGSRMRRGLEPDHLRAEDDRPVVLVVRQMVYRGVDRHVASSVLSLITFPQLRTPRHSDVALPKAEPAMVMQAGPL